MCLFVDQIRELIQERFSRGKFNISINWSGAGESGEELKLNEAVADRYVALLNQLKEKVVAAKDSPAGKHGGIFAQVVIDRGGELITLNTGGTELRIDVPLPPKVAVATPMTPMTPTPPPMPPAGQPEKRQTRLDKLRLEQEDREKAAAAGGAPAPKKEEPKKEEPKKAEPVPKAPGEAPKKEEPPKKS